MPAVPLSRPREIQLPDDRSVLDRLALALGARDILVFRRVQPGRFLQVGGLGRGAGWAGNIDLRAEQEPEFFAAVAAQRVHQWETGFHRQVVGPYFAATAALVPLGRDVAVLFGTPTGALSAGPDDLRAAAVTAVQLVEEINPSKRLADELELLHAVRSVVQCRAMGLQEVLQHVATAAAEAVSCEVGLVWLPERHGLAVALQGWSLGASEEEVMASLAQAPFRPDLTCVQDSARSPLPAPLAPQNGVRSHLVVPLGEPAEGFLVLLHTDKTPRGFTDLCQSVAAAIAEAAGVLIHSALLREELERLLASTHDAARLDGLTGLGNRRCWDESLAAAQVTIGHGSSVGVLVMDLDRLKAVNDAYGHDAGDRYLQAAARLLTECAREGDVIARIGGDEFAVLVQSDDPRGVERLAATLRARLAFGSDDLTVPAASVGYAVCPPYGSLGRTVIAADGRMYQEKARTRPSA